MAYPNFFRLVARPARYAGTADPGEQRTLGGGVLTQRSGLALFVPDLPAVPPRSALRRP